MVLHCRSRSNPRRITTEHSSYSVKLYLEVSGGLYGEDLGVVVEVLDFFFLADVNFGVVGIEFCLLEDVVTLEDDVGVIGMGSVVVVGCFELSDS